MPTMDDIRNGQRVTWAALSDGWERWDAIIMDQLGPVSDAMIAALAITEGQHHLDVAAGTGEPGLTIAERAPRGHVVLTDLVAEMLEIATRRAAARRITNFETRICSADALPFPDASFDSVSVRFGYMFLPDVDRATAELVRVLRPGGRLCASVWAERAANPWTTIVMDAIAAAVTLPPTDPQAPNMFRCAAPGYLTARFEAAGLREVEERDVDVVLSTSSAREYWAMTSEHVSLAVAALQRLDAAGRTSVAEAVIAAVSRYDVDGTVRVPGRARCAAGTKPIAA